MPVIAGSGTDLVVSSGQVEKDIVLRDRRQRVLDGGTTMRTVVSSGGEQIVSAGGKAVGTVISTGGIQTTQDGAEITGTVIAGGVQRLNGIAVATTILDGGRQIIALGEARATTISSGGLQIVSSGTSAVNTTVSSGGVESVGISGTATGTTVSNGGMVTVSSGAKVTGEILSGGAVALAGGRFVGTIASGGREIVKTTLHNITVSNGLTLEVGLAGQTAGTIVESGGVEIIAAGGFETRTKIMKGGEIVFGGGFVQTVVAEAGAREIVASGGRQFGLTVTSGVTLTVQSGGSAGDTTLNGGTEIVLSGAILTGTTTFKKDGKLTTAATGAVSLFTSGFRATNTIDFRSFEFNNRERLSYDKFQGLLTITDGASHARISMFGQYVAAGFHLTADAAGGTELTYSPPAAPHSELPVVHS